MPNTSSSPKLAIPDHAHRFYDAPPHHRHRRSVQWSSQPSRHAASPIGSLPCDHHTTNGLIVVELIGQRAFLRRRAFRASRKHRCGLRPIGQQCQFQIEFRDWRVAQSARAGGSLSVEELLNGFRLRSFIILRRERDDLRIDHASHPARRKRALHEIRLRRQFVQARGKRLRIDITRADGHCTRRSRPAIPDRPRPTCNGGAGAAWRRPSTPPSYWAITHIGAGG